MAIGGECGYGIIRVVSGFWVRGEIGIAMKQVKMINMNVGPVKMQGNGNCII